MAVFAIGDLHLPGHDEKPMNVFGAHWEHHFETISENWKRMIGEQDIVLLPGDTSWAMQLEDVLDDLAAVASLPGQKILLRGNHDYWWSSLKKMEAILPYGIRVLQNNAVRADDYIIAGTRGWVFPTEQQPLGDQDQKVYLRELIRLKMSLDEAARLKKEQDGTIIVMLHYPPLFADGLPTEWTKLLESYPVQDVVYGHLHGAGIKIGFEGLQNNIHYHLVSCDALHFCPLRLN